jgi:hypothetical protein
MAAFFCWNKEETEKKKETSEGETEHRNEIGVRSFGRTSERERETHGDKHPVLNKYADSA